jgi:hypothetical protein
MGVYVGEKKTTLSRERKYQSMSFWGKYEKWKKKGENVKEKGKKIKEEAVEVKRVKGKQKGHN